MKFRTEWGATGTELMVKLIIPLLFITILEFTINPFPVVKRQFRP